MESPPLHKLLTFCKKCNKIPFIIIHSTNPATVQVTCPCETKVESLDEYYEELLDINLTLNDLHCDSHEEKKSSIFCFTCNKHLCSSCYKTHNKDHLLSPMKNECGIVKDHEHKIHLGFCHNCFKNDCMKCTIEHDSHRMTHYGRIEKNFYFGKWVSFLKALIGMKKKLTETKEQVINELKNKIKKIEKNYIMCLQRNFEILRLIGIIYNNYCFFNIRGFHYQSCVNLLSNSNFTIDDKTYKSLPHFRNEEDAVTFFQRFCVIKEKTVYEDYYKENCNKNEKLININTSSKITSLLLHKDNTHIILGKENGELGIVNIENDTFSNDFFSAHSSCISLLVPLSNDKFATCSNDPFLNIWKIEEKEDKCVCCFHSFYLGDEGGMSTAASLSNNRVGFITSLGNLFVYSIGNSDTVLYKDSIYSNHKFIIPFGLYSKILVVITTNSEILFYNIEESHYKKEEKKITLISTFTHNSVCVTSSNMLLVLGRLSNDPNTYLFIISIQNKSIETICEYQHGLIQNYNRLFVLENINEIKYRTNFYNVLSIDKNSFLLNKVHSSPVAAHPYEILFTQHGKNNNHILLLDNNKIQIINYS